MTITVTRCKLFIEQIFDPTRGGIGVIGVTDNYNLGARPLYVSPEDGPTAIPDWVSGTQTYLLGVQDGSITVVG